MMSGNLSPLMSVTTNCVPTPLSLSISCLTQVTSLPLRCSSNQTSTAGSPGFTSPVGPCAQKRLPVTRSFSPSPLMSASSSACDCEKLLSIVCVTNVPSFCCSCHQTPILCAALDSTSGNPSPFTSYTCICAHSSPK